MGNSGCIPKMIFAPIRIFVHPSFHKGVIDGF